MDYLRSKMSNVLCCSHYSGDDGRRPHNTQYVSSCVTIAASSAPPCGTAVLTVDTRLTLRHCRATHELINVTMAHPNRLLHAHTPWEINDIKLYIMLSLKIYRLMNPNTFSTNSNFCNSVNLYMY